MRYDQLIAGAETQVERNVLGFLEAGHTQKQIAENLRITLYQVRVIIRKLRERCKAA